MVETTRNGLNFYTHSYFTSRNNILLMHRNSFKGLIPVNSGAYLKCEPRDLGCRDWVRPWLSELRHVDKEYRHAKSVCPKILAGLYVGGVIYCCESCRMSIPGAILSTIKIGLPDLGMRFQVPNSAVSLTCMKKERMTKCYIYIDFVCYNFSIKL